MSIRVQKEMGIKENRRKRLLRMDANLYNEVVTEIRKTNNYSMFKNMIGNRELKDKNYKKLMRSMSEKQLIIPILVNEKLEIIDGQHRFIACKNLQLPVYYYIIPGYEIDDVKRANLVSCNWNLDDYLNLHIQLAKGEYAKFLDLKNKYNLKTSQLSEIIATLEQKEYGRVKLCFEDGSFEIDNIMIIEKFLMDLSDFSNFKDCYSTKFSKAFLRLYMHNAYNHTHMQKKLKTLSHKLNKRQTYSDYLSMLVNDIYSFGSASAKFKYDAVGNRFYQI